MVTLAGVEPPCASVATRAKTRTAAGDPAGTTEAVNVGGAGSAGARGAAAPDGRVHASVMGSPSGSALALPSSVTADPEATAWSGPAFAMGAGFGGACGLAGTLTAAASELVFASLTTSEKVRTTGSCPNGTVGALNVGCAAIALDSDTTGPAVCVQANDSTSPAGSELALASRVTKAPEATA